MQITHEEAHALIHFHADGTLSTVKRQTLSEHLKDCVACRRYASELQEVENSLQHVMNKQWHAKLTPLSVQALTQKKEQSERGSITLVTRMAMISIILLGFLFSFWQMTSSNKESPEPPAFGILPAPTPSAQLTSTKITTRNCEEIRYQVHEGDTLESLAIQFSTTKETILLLNHLKAETIHPNMELILPLCSSTPTGTTSPLASTTTLTPGLNLASYTPRQ